MNIQKEMVKQARDRMALRREMQEDGVEFTFEFKVIEIPHDRIYFPPGKFIITRIIHKALQKAIHWTTK